MIHSTLAVLLQACQAGDEGAVDELVRAYRPGVFRLALSFLDDAAEADEAAQEAFLAALRGLRRYRGDAAFTTWLWTITANVCRGRLRKRRAEQRLAQALQVLFRIAGSRPAQPEEAALLNEADAEIWRSIRELPESLRLAVVLRYYHDLGLAEIAAVLRVSERTVHNRLRAAHQRLRGKLSRKGNER